MSEPTPLTALQCDILALEAKFWRQPGAKHVAFRARHRHITETAYYVVLNRLLDDPAAAQHQDGRYALLLRRLREIRDAGRRR